MIPAANIKSEDGSGTDWKARVENLSLSKPILVATPVVGSIVTSRLPPAETIETIPQSCPSSGFVVRANDLPLVVNPGEVMLIELNTEPLAGSILNRSVTPSKSNPSKCSRV